MHSNMRAGFIIIKDACLRWSVMRCYFFDDAGTGAQTKIGFSPSHDFFELKSIIVFISDCGMSLPHEGF